MHMLDLLVLLCYFLLMVAIGVYCSLRIKAQEDYFLGGRSFGKLLQTFAAFGAGTGSSDPVNTGRTTFTGGMSGMWSVMFWLFVTPFYWITGVWYRRMRLLTLGDWYVERYESRGLGAAYSIFGVFFFMIYGSMFFSAIAKTAEPMMLGSAVAVSAEASGTTANSGTLDQDKSNRVSVLGTKVKLQTVLIPVIAVVVVAYGIAGGLAAAYFTDLIQGICIIGLSVMLIPIGLNALSDNPELNPGGKNGFQVMHEQLPESFFDVIGNSGSEISLLYLTAMVLANLTGIVVQPHFIATGGGSAKTEYNARVGLVVGNFLKRFCTLGWVLTALIAATLYADVPALVENPDLTWGYASMQLLGPGFRGLMLACLLAALMSSVDAQMVVGAGLIVRNLYVPFLRPDASERECLWAGRLTGMIVVAGACFFALTFYDMLKQLELTFWFPLVFASPFWIGMYWRRATGRAAWITVVYCLFFFFVIPFFGPKVFTSLRTNAALMTRTPHTVTTSPTVVSRSMLRQKLSEAELVWAAAGQDLTGPELAQHNATKPRSLSPEKIEIPGPEGMQVIEAGVTRLPQIKTSKSTSIFWSSIEPVDETIALEVVATDVNERTGAIQETLDYPAGTLLQGTGSLKLNLLFYKPLGVDLGSQSISSLKSLDLFPKIAMPFLVMIIASLLTRKNSEEALERYYAKMKTPVDPNPEADQQKLAAAYADPSTCERVKLFPNSDLEFQKPTTEDIVGFTLSFLICFAIIGMAFWITTLGV
ncbi:MAG: hypothetical protein CMJ70_15620 [Planctomycetaceae bacterium]|nr:hypothetical protein [Planctomycetaceae bacterium]